MKPAKLIILLLFISVNSYGQLFTQYYPIGDQPNIRYMSSYTKQETILFEANPIVKYSFYNNFYENLVSNKKCAGAAYLSFRPQLRMYTTNSKPVRTPSYRIFVGTQHLFRLTESTTTQDFAGFSVESGHYSNGQDRSSFSDKYDDGSAQGDSIYGTLTDDTDLSAILNRTSGNFSTNLTEVIGNYRHYKIDDNNEPTEMISVNLGLTVYHNRFLFIANFGGYTQQDIEIYGQVRYLAGIEYMKTFCKGMRLTLSDHLEVIQGAHKWVNPVRNEFMCTVYPFRKMKSLGFLASYIYGHDNYNYRFVDADHQVTFGVTWTLFPPFQLRGI